MPCLVGFSKRISRTKYLKVRKIHIWSTKILNFKDFSVRPSSLRIWGVLKSENLCIDTKFDTDTHPYAPIIPKSSLLIYLDEDILIQGMICPLCLDTKSIAGIERIIKDCQSGYLTLAGEAEVLKFFMLLLSKAECRSNINPPLLLGLETGNTIRLTI